MANLLDIKYDIETLLHDIKSYVDSNKELPYSSGEICPRCNSLNSYRSYDSRINSDGYRIRYKKCNNCNHKWKTVEIVYSDNVRGYEKGEWKNDI